MSDSDRANGAINGAARHVFVLGGTRSGKSRFALELARELGGDGVTFVATARSGDPELDRRIAAHRRERPSRWGTVEAGDDLAEAIRAGQDAHVLLVDSLTLWVAGVLEGATSSTPSVATSSTLSVAPSSTPSVVASAWPAVAATILARTAPVVVVSDEVGLGIVPISAAGRQFRDELGWLNQRVAALADEVHLLVAGIPMTLKSR